MAIDETEIVLSAVVEISIPDPQGRNVKPRPVVVIGFEDDESTFVFCAISTTFRIPLSRHQVRLPHDGRGGHPATGLFRESVAVCTWVDVAKKADVIKKWGYLPMKVFKRIVEQVEALADEDG